MGDALEAHEQSIEDFGGLGGISNLDALLGAIGRPYHGYHRMIYEKGAALLHGIATAHGFNDGNKRTAWILTEDLYLKSGYVIAIDDDEPIDDLVVDVVLGVVTQEDLKRWLKERTVRL